MGMHSKNVKNITLKSNELFKSDTANQGRRWQIVSGWRQNPEI